MGAHLCPVAAALHGAPAPVAAAGHVEVDEPAVVGTARADAVAATRSEHGDRVACDGGEEGLAYLAAHRAEITAVLTDIKMPGLTGFGVIEQIRRRTDGAALPVIVISSSELPEDKARASALGADDYLVKFPAPEAIAMSLRAACAARAGRVAT